MAINNKGEDTRYREAIYQEDIERVKQDLRNYGTVCIMISVEDKEREYRWIKADVAGLYTNHAVFSYRIRKNQEKQSFTYAELVIMARKYGWNRIFGRG